MLSLETSELNNKYIDCAGRYTSTLASGALLVRESRIVASLLLQNISIENWKKELYTNNILQLSRPSSIKTISNLLRSRLSVLSPNILKLVRDAPFEIASQACLASAVKHSYLLGDFLDLVVRDAYHGYSNQISYSLWSQYLLTCRSRDITMPSWAESTCYRLGKVVFQILVQSGFIESASNSKVQNVHINSQLLDYLKGDLESYVIRCITLGRAT